MAQKYEKRTFNKHLYSQKIDYLLVTAWFNAIVLNKVFQSVGVPYKKLKFSHIISRLNILTLK